MIDNEKQNNEKLLNDGSLKNKIIFENQIIIIQ